MASLARATRSQAICTAIALCIAVGLAVAGLVPSVRAQAPTNGLIMLIEFEKIEGIRHWERELDKLGLTALVQAQNNVLKEFPDDFARLAARGYTISGIDAEKPFWDVAYDDQFARMREVKQSVERITRKPMRVFGSRYFAYDENTLRAADALGIEYVLGRGTAGALATTSANSKKPWWRKQSHANPSLRADSLVTGK